MASTSDWTVPPAARPKLQDYDFDLDRTLSAVVGLRSLVPEEAVTAQTLGTERVGHGVLIEDGIVLTIGYLVMEAETIWLALSSGGAVPGHLLGYDYDSGFGLVQPLARLDLPCLTLGRSCDVGLQNRVVMAGAGGRNNSVAARIIAKQEFAGYWEYLLDEALFTAPAHPHWGGTGLIDVKGELVGIGSLQFQQGREGRQLNMVVPIDLLKPIINDLRTLGRPNRPPRPWLGLYATEMDNRIVLVGFANGGPAQRSELRTGDLVIAVNGVAVKDLAGFFRQVWSLGQAGVEVPLTINRDGQNMPVVVESIDRRGLFKKPQLH
jgi:S1-C subfamily serine protease